MSASRGLAPATGAAGRAGPRASADDLAYCRRVLPLVSRTFAINIRLLSGSLGDAVRTAYLLCRIADTLEDAWGGRRAQVEHRFDLLLAALWGDDDAARALAHAASRAAGAGGEESHHASLVANTDRVWRCFVALDPADRGIVAEAVSVMARGMRRYAARAADPEAGRAARSAPPPWILDERELGEYCWIVAGCIGVMLTGLVARRSPASPAVEARRVTLAPAVGEGLQLTNILLDWPRDVRLGRCYLPATWLAEEGLRPDQLVGAPHPGVARLVDRLERRARLALDSVPDYLDTWPVSQVRYRQFCLWPSLWALASIDHARRDLEFPWGERRPRVPRAALWRTALSALAGGHGDAGVRRLFARFGSRAAGPVGPSGR